jgi:ParB family transcriptional regulator, chromosome partitioning protein
MSETATGYQAGCLYEVAPGELKVGPNVRTDARPDAREFAASIKQRGVLEVITAHLDTDGGLTVVRGQRRTLVAASVGTPTGTVPVRVVASPEDVDRIIDQVTENVHREGMRVRETRDAIEQLALLGVSAAQIARRAALPRPVVNTALAVVAHQATKERMDAQDMTLDDAAIFAEFEDDQEAIASLTEVWNHPWQRNRMGHYAQRLRDERAERGALHAEIERLRGQGLPVLDPHDAPDDVHHHCLMHLRTEDGEQIPEEQWPTIPGAAVVVTTEWTEPDDDGDGAAEPEQVYVPVWVCTDPAAAGLHYPHRTRAAASDDAAGPEPDDAGAAREAEEEARRAAESAERRRVIAGNKAWRSAEVVRREWLAGLLSRRTVPAGAEALIARAVLLCEYSLSHALQHGHSLLLADLLGVKPDQAAPAYQRDRATCARILEQATTPKAATMRTLAAVLAAWQERSGTHTWRNPDGWDAAVMGALIGWGYPASDVEQLLVPGADEPAPEPGPEG